MTPNPPRGFEPAVPYWTRILVVSNPVGDTTIGSPT